MEPVVRVMKRAKTFGKLVTDAPFMLLALDRDGTVIEHVPYLHGPEHVALLPTAAETIAQANSLHVPVVIVTNQSGVAHGKFTLKDVDDVNAEMIRQLKASGANVSAIYICPHAALDGCNCRKPRPGLILGALRDYGTEASEVLMVGDNVTDGFAAEAAGARFVGVLTGVNHDAGVGGKDWTWQRSLEQAVFPQ